MRASTFEELPNPEDPCFPNGQQMTAQNLSWVTEPFKFKMAPWVWMHWYEMFFDVVSDSMLQLTFQKQ